MNRDPAKPDGSAPNAARVVPVTREMVHLRTRALALIAGRGPLQVSQADYEQARRELTGETDVDRQETRLDLVPKAKRRDPVSS